VEDRSGTSDIELDGTGHRKYPIGRPRRDERPRRAGASGLNPANADPDNL
jgi:hypothetical protein